jgi:hypothetical protein
MNLLAPPSLMSLTSFFMVVPLTIESSTTTTPPPVLEHAAYWIEFYLTLSCLDFWYGEMMCDRHNGF